jgi:hypothetical protein
MAIVQAQRLAQAAPAASGMQRQRVCVAPKACAAAQPARAVRPAAAAAQRRVCSSSGRRAAAAVRAAAAPATLHELTIQPVRVIEGHVKLPGSKSLSNRILLLAALAEGTTTVENILVRRVVRRVPSLPPAISSLPSAWLAAGINPSPYLPLPPPWPLPSVTAANRTAAAPPTLPAPCPLLLLRLLLL